MLLIAKPAGPPLFVNSEPETDWIDFLSQLIRSFPGKSRAAYLPSDSPSVRITFT